jgi:ABC-2 type transport system permease protein
MLEDIGTVIWKELKELQAQAGRGRLGKVMLLLAFVPGLVLPLQFGRAWVETPIALLTLGLVPVIVFSVVADAIAGERERHTLETLLASCLPDYAILYGKLGAATLYVMSQVLTFIVPSLLLVNLLFVRGELVVYPAPVWLGVFLLGPLLTILLGGIAMLISMRARTVRQAHLIVMLVTFVGFLVAPIVLGAVVVVMALVLSITVAAEDLRATVEAARRVGLLGGIVALALLVTALDLLLMVFVQTRFRRTRLALD